MGPTVGLRVGCLPLLGSGCSFRDGLEVSLLLLGCSLSGWSFTLWAWNEPTIGSYNHYHLSPNGIPSGIQRWYGLVYIIHMAGNPRIRPRK